MFPAIAHTFWLSINSYASVETFSDIGNTFPAIARAFPAIVCVVWLSINSYNPVKTSSDIVNTFPAISTEHGLEHVYEVPNKVQSLFMLMYDL